MGDAAGWEVLGVGRKDSEETVYLLHPCGKGGVDEKVAMAGKKEEEIWMGKGTGLRALGGRVGSKVRARARKGVERLQQ